MADHEPLTDLHAALGQVGTVAQAKRTKQELEACLRSKQAPRKPQAEPIGLFAQTQGQLF